MFAGYSNFSDKAGLCPYFEFYFMKSQYFKISGFEKNICEKDVLNFSKFSNSFYFPLGCSRKSILDTFGDIPVNFVKNISSQLWVIYE